jgi:hypothetical protein
LYFRKFFSFLSIFILIGISSNSVYIIDGIETIQDDFLIVNNDPSDFVNYNEQSLILDEIMDGLGFRIKIRNIANREINSILMYINITGGIRTELPVNEIWIGDIEEGETSGIIEIMISGFGLGIFTKKPEITFRFESPYLKEPKIITITAKLIGRIILIDSEKPSEGESHFYTIFGPEYSTNIYLLNNSNKEIVHLWDSDYIQGLGVYLLENGNIARLCLPYVNQNFIAGGVAGRVEIFNWEGTLIWGFDYSNDQHCLHHDIEVLPNGNILMIAWEFKTIEEASIAGRDVSLDKDGIWPEHIIEVEPTGSSGGNIVWEWHVWDHLIQEYDPTKENYGMIVDHPELIDVNSAQGDDWIHMNSIDYNEEFDQILLSARFQNEIWIIDHSTTTQEAAGHNGGKYGKGGDLLYRWGNPKIYQMGDITDQRLYGQHDATWIESGYPGEGNILVFNNGIGRLDGFYSSVDEIIPPVDEDGNYIKSVDSTYGPEEPVWIYTTEIPGQFAASSISGAERLKNGDTMICNGPSGRFFQVTWDLVTVWNYDNPYPTSLTNDVFKIRSYPSDYPGLSNLF